MQTLLFFRGGKRSYRRNVGTLERKHFTILSNYETCNIYNVDEFGIFYQVLPQKTLNLKKEKCAGGQHSKTCLTGLAAVSMNGEKLPMFVIGKSEKSRCVKGIKKLPCRYREQKKSWMNSEIFEEWVRELDGKFEKEQHKAALIVDNCPVHPEIGELKMFKSFFFSFSYLLIRLLYNPWIIRSLKAKCRTKNLQKIIVAIDNHKSLPTTSITEAKCSFSYVMMCLPQV